MLETILSYDLDLIAFAILALVAMALVQIWLRWRKHATGLRSTWILPLLVVPVSIVIAQASGDADRARLRNMLVGIAPTYAQELERMDHARITGNTPQDDSLLRSLTGTAQRWLKANPCVSQIYTFARDTGGAITVLVDSGDESTVRAKQLTARYQYQPIVLEKAFLGVPAFEDIPHSDESGTWVSAFVPLHDSPRHTSAVLGVDFPAEDWLRSIVWHRAAVLGGGAVLIAVLLASTAATTVLRAEMARRRTVEDEVKQARTVAEAANKAKSEFLANMSHEIRTPMTAILGYTELLLERDLTTDQRISHVSIIRQNGEHLLSLINDILDLSKIEAGHMSTERIACSPIQVLHEVESLMCVRATERKLNLQITVAGPIPVEIKSDPTRLRQILLNLTSNAIKFTRQGSVRLTVKMDGSRMVFDVADSGIGMPPEQVARLFQPFMQGDTSTTRNFGGTGLGLAISRRLARMMGGDISVKSEVGVGSVFTLSIDPGDVQGVATVDFYKQPIRESDAAGAAHQTRQLGGRILLAEDTPANAHLFTHWLKKAGAEVTWVENGRIACDVAFAAAGTGKPFDIILMDMQMPEMDGYAAAAKFRAHGYTVPIIALTAHAMAEDRAKCLRAGCTDFLTKPMKMTQLLETIAKHMPGVPAQVLRSEQSHDAELREFLQKFVAGLPHYVQNIENALRANDAKALAAVVHDLKGTGGLYGFPTITQSAAAAEHLIREGQNATTAIGELIDLIRSVEGYPAKESQVSTRSA